MMYERANEVYQLAKKMYEEQANDYLVDLAYHAYLMKRCADQECVEYSPNEFIEKCNNDAVFFTYFLSYC